MRQTRLKRKELIKGKLKGVGSSAISGAATGSALGYGVGHLLQKGSSLKETKIGTAVGLLGGAAAGALNKYKQNRKRR